MDSLFDIEIFRTIWGVAIAILFFGGTVFVHELGHFLAAKKRGLKVERFSIGFGPRVWGWTGKDGVDYRLSLFPLGGYVALPQMADMSAVEGAVEDDAEKLPKIGYADKMIVAVMGAAFNVLFAIVLACILWIIGMPDNSQPPIIGRFEDEIRINEKGDKVPGPAARAGAALQIGDRILAVDDTPVANFGELINAMALGTGRRDGKPVVSLTIERDGKRLPAPVVLYPVLADEDGTGDTRRMVGIGAATPISVDISKDKNSVAAKAGLKTGDRILAVDGVKMWDIEQFRNAIALISDSAKFVVEREVDGKPATLEITVTPELRKVRNATVVLEFADGDTRRSVELVPSPAEPDFNDKDLLKAPRPSLMVCENAGADPARSDALTTGTIVYGVSGGKSGVMQRPADFDALKKIVETSGGDLTLYLRTDGKVSNLALRQVTMRVKDVEMRKTVNGVAPRREPGKPVSRPPWHYLGETFSTTMGTLKALFSPGSDVGVRHLSGVIGIARIYYSISDSFRGLLWFTILINVNLAILNLLPLPVLDGGHMVYATLEKIRGRPLPGRVVETIQLAFVIIFFGLMAYVLSQDIRRLNAGGGALREQLARLLVSEPLTPNDK